ncbi:MAG: hypothetical protein AB7O44_27565 [Hyphomicrobiaceae bacterium]
MTTTQAGRSPHDAMALELRELKERYSALEANSLVGATYLEDQLRRLTEERDALRKALGDVLDVWRYPDAHDHQSVAKIENRARAALGEQR